MDRTQSEDEMNYLPPESRQPPAPPPGVAISGIIFSTLYILSLVLIRLAVPVDPTDQGEWLADGNLRQWVRTALNLVPITGIAFLWFMGALRSHLGSREDRFFATVFLGSGLLFVATLFASAVVAGSLLEAYTVESRLAGQSETFEFGRRASHLLMNIFALKMSAVFIFVTSSIALRTAFLPRWLAFVGFSVGLVLLLVITEFPWIVLLFPLWVLLVSAYILFAELHKRTREK